MCPSDHYQDHTPLAYTPTRTTHRCMYISPPRQPGVRSPFPVPRGERAGGGVSGTVLDGGVAVAEVAEVVDVGGGEEGAGCEGVDGGVAPLRWLLEDVSFVLGGGSW